MANYNPFSLQSKKILVTGASSGIGRAVAIECSRLGANVYLTGRNEEQLNATFDALSDGEHVCLKCDITNSDDLKELITSLPELSGIVHCAGLTTLLPIQYATKEKLDSVFNVNFYAPAELSRMLLRSKKITKNGSIVFISSISGVYCSSISSSVYSASKGALNGLMKGMALDLASKQIRVNAINPGVIDTGFFKASGITDEDLKKDTDRYPLKRHGRPEEVAYAAIYLLSDASAWTTGSNLLIDGGYTLL